MASIRKLKSGRYNVQIRGKGLPSRSATFDTIEAAQHWVATTAHEGACKGAAEPAHTPLQRHQHSTSEDFSFLKLADRYCSMVLKGRPSEAITSKRVARIAAHLPQDVRTITKHDLNQYRLMRLQQVSPVTCRDELQLIHRIFRWCHRELILDAAEYPSPCSEISMPPPSKPRNRVITRSELQLILTELSPVMRSITELAYETAMRRGEILKLVPRHLELEKGILSVVDGKTGDRSVPLTERAVELLRIAADGCLTQDNPLYPVTPHAVSRAFSRARKRLRMDDSVRFHQLRHSRITEVAKNGFNQAQIMMVSGHRDVRSVQRYTHLNVIEMVTTLREMDQ